MMMKIPRILLALLLIGFSSYGQSDNLPADVKTAPWFVEKFRISAGFFVPVTSTTIQVDVEGKPGSEIDFNKDLGYSQAQATFSASLQWRISRRSRLNFNYYNIPRGTTHTLKRDIVFDGTTYPVDASVKTFFNTAIYQISYGYAILAKPKYELGVMIGTHLVGGKVGISLSGANVTGSDKKDFGFTAPLPDLGIWGGYAISERFAVTLDADYLSLTIDNITGSIWSYDLLFLYKLAEKWNLSLGFSGLNFKVGVEKKDATGNLKWGYNGPSLGVSYSFGKKSWMH